MLASLQSGGPNRWWARPLRLIFSFTVLPSQTVITHFHLTEWGLEEPIS